ncbi:P-II family nitrogen regulator [Kaarinaea lacus]
MAINLVVAIVRESRIKSVVSKLYENSIPGVTISPVRGYGEHVNVYSQDITEGSVRVEVFVAETFAQLVVEIIMSAAQTGLQGDGVVAVLPVSSMYQTKDCTQLKDHQLMPGSNDTERSS